MKPVMLYGLIISLFLSFGSCKNTDEEFQPDDALPPVPEGYVRMQIIVPGLNPASTYAPDESGVSEIDVLVFDSNDKYLCRAYALGQDITGAGNTKTFDVDLGTAAKTVNACVMVVANAHDAVDAAGFTSSTTTENAMELLEFTLPGAWPVDGSKLFPMWGMDEINLYDTGSIPSITMIRSVAGIDVGVNFNGTDAAQGLETTFTLESVRLYNSPDKGSVAPYNGKYDSTNKKVTAPSIPDGAVANATGITYPASTENGFDTGKLSCTGAIYMFEQYAEPVNNDRTKRPCLVIGGKYNGSQDVTYYRLDFVTGSYPSQTFLPVLRNHRYRFDITEVKGPGYGTVQDAFDAVPFNMTVSLSAMNESLVTSYTYDGQYALGTSHDSYNPDNRQHTDTLYISTTYGSYSATASTGNGDWLRFGSVPGSGDTSIPVTTVSNTPVMLTFNVTENDSGLQRDGTITITSGLLTKTVSVTQKNTADGFMVTPANSISYTSGGAKNDFKVTSSWKWNVRIKEDPDAIISAFTSGGNAGTNLTYSFTIATSNSHYDMPDTPAATLVFFSPAGEFPEEERTVSIPAHAIAYQPSTHMGWAGSNIYWDQSLRGGNGALTFANTLSSTPDSPIDPETYQGVYFKLGSLVGLGSSPSAWGSSCQVYVPTWNPDDPTASSWAGTNAGSSNPVYTVWTDIPYVKDGNNSNKSVGYLTKNDATPTVDNDSKGGHVPVPDRAVLPANMKGDICRYLTQTGDAPGADAGTKWRMPTATEFGSATSEYSKEASGFRKTSNPRPDANGYKPWFRFSGCRRITPTGTLFDVGSAGFYWSSTPTSYLNMTGSTVSFPTFDRTYALTVRCVKE